MLTLKSLCGKLLKSHCTVLRDYTMNWGEQRRGDILAIKLRLSWSDESFLRDPMQQPESREKDSLLVEFLTFYLWVKVEEDAAG